MIKGLNHVAIAVPDLSEASASYAALGAKISAPQDLPEHGVTVVFVTLENTKIELLHPLGEGSPIAAFLDRNPSGGIHHLCFEVEESPPPPKILPGAASAFWAMANQRPAHTASRSCSPTPRIFRAF